jgi:hypothetical protein
MNFIEFNHGVTERTEKSFKYLCSFFAAKQQKKNIKLFFLCVLRVSVVIFISGCIAPTASPSVTAVRATATVTASETAAPSRTPLPTATATATLTPPPPTATSTPSLTATATPDVRLDPADWRQWPVIPRVTGRGLEIYLAGLARGNDPHAFSKVADCQGIREVLLGAYDQPGVYKLSEANAGLQETIDWFKGSFNRNGMATLGGFNARAVLQPWFADPAACLPGETPIECEYRVHRPSIVLISLEFGYDGRTTANYIQYMRQIIDFFISKGVLPILSTKADNAEGDMSLNQANADLAYEYDLPLWNWWREAQGMYNHGMDPTRPDGFHISVDAWRRRSATALQALDAVWRGVRDAGAAVQAVNSTPSVQVSVTATAVPREEENAPALDPQAAQLIASGHALIGLAQRKGEGYEYLGVYVLDPQKPEMEQLLGAGWRLQDVAPDGKSMLVSQGTDLWQAYFDGTTPLLLTNQLFAGIQTTAVYVKNSVWAVAIIGTQASGPALYAVGRGGQPRSFITSSSHQSEPVELFPSQDSSKVYWLAVNCNIPSCPPQMVKWAIPDDPQAISDLPGVTDPAVSSDGDSLAYTFLNEKERSVLAVTTLERAKIWSPLPDGYAMDYAWSPSGRWLAALLLERSDYSGRPGALDPFLLNPADLTKVNLAPISGLSPRLAWSADGRYVLVAATHNFNVRNTDMDKGYRLDLYLVNVGSGQVSLLDGKISPASQEYLLATNLSWLP